MMIRYESNKTELPIMPVTICGSGEKRNAYCAAVITLDTETTTFFRVGGEWKSEKYTTEKERKDCKDYIGIVYVWQININGIKYYGRTRDELINLFDILNKINPAVKVIYIHNLNYDYSFISDILPVNDLVARAKMSPLRIKTEYNIELRDSYALSNMSLASIAKSYNYGKKLVGDLDYTEARLPNTPLTEKELEYCEQDIEILYQYIYNQWYLPYHGDYTQIPLTQTGVARRAIKDILFKDKKYIKKQKQIKPATINEYKLLRDAFMGGVAHANYLYSNTKFEPIPDVWSYDRASSYPSEMVTRKFPCGKFIPLNDPEKNLNIYDENYCEIVTIKYHNITAETAWSYISNSKCKQLSGETIDNGRIIKADILTITITNIDMQIINALYRYDEAEILSAYIAPADYLHIDYVKKVLELYGNKTKLKKSDPALYMHSKQILNSLYGMMVTDIVREEVSFDNNSGEWCTEYENLSDDEIQKLMLQKLNDNKPFINYSAGVFVTAFARQALFAPLMSIDPRTKVVDGIGNDVIYTDTDSLKIVNNEKNKHFIEDYNVKMLERLHKAARDLNLPYELFAPKDPAGKPHPLGVFECEGKYETFATMGAKKYVYRKNGDFGFTVAGLQKSYVDETGEHLTMQSEQEFYSGSAIEHGRTNYVYTTSQLHDKLIDYMGNVWYNDYERGVAMWRTTYTFSVSKDYALILKQVAERIGEYENRMYNKVTSPFSIINERLGIK